MVHKDTQAFPNPIGQWVTSLAVALAVTNGVSYLYNNYRDRAKVEKIVLPPQATTPVTSAIAALGRLEPQGEITRISAPASLEGTKIAQVLVKNGDKVAQGQAIALLDSHNRRLTQLEKAKADVQIAQARLAKVKAGAKAGEIKSQQEKIAGLKADLQGQIATQKAEIARLEAELQNAELEALRHQFLYQQGAVSASETDSIRLKAKTTQELLIKAKAKLIHTIETNQIQQSEAKAVLNSIAEVRPVDVQEAEAQLQSAIADVQQAQAELDLTYIRSPIDGQILKVNARAGEVVGTEGIADIGQTNQMYVVAEVYETDINKIHPGQKAIITGAAFSGELEGEVAQIGLQVNQQNVFANDPQANTDNKVVEVKIRLNPVSSQKVSGLSNLQVQAVINI
jgi:HlyD family secretion protein